MLEPFLAIDFETANPSSDSACSIGLVRGENGRIVHEEVHLIRPPNSWFQFTEIHGLTWEHVRDALTFEGVWPKIKPLFEGVNFIAAHNAGFDRKVLESCCELYKLEKPTHPYICTVQLARKTWSIFPTRLPNVCEVLGIELKHHEALSDARACAKIVIAAQHKQNESLDQTSPRMN